MVLWLQGESILFEKSDYKDKNEDTQGTWSHKILFSCWDPITASLRADKALPRHWST